MRIDGDWLLTSHRLALHEPTRTAVLADLHLGYSAARRKAGDAIPMRSIADELEPLRQACAAFDIRRLVCAGDLCEAGMSDALVDSFLASLAECRVELTAIVPGNHDRGWQAFRDRLPMMPDGIDVGEWRIVHGDGVLPTGATMLGHHHPTWRGRPCFLVGPRRIVLPAFSTDAAGGGVEGKPRWRGYRVFAIQAGEIVEGELVGPTKSRHEGLFRRWSH